MRSSFRKGSGTNGFLELGSTVDDDGDETQVTLTSQKSKKITYDSRRDRIEVDFESMPQGVYPVELKLQDISRDEQVKSTQTFLFTIAVIEADAKEPTFRIASISSRGLVTL